jgi:glycosyltransferase involved in cell wall biosynthesis
VRIVFMQNGVLAYQDTCMRELAALGNDILIVCPASMEGYHFDGTRFGDYGETLMWDGEPPTPAELVRRVEDFRPDVVLMRSHKGKAYRAVMKAVKGDALRVLFMSNVWLNTPRQWIGRLTHRLYVDPLFEACYTPGERSEWFLRRLGFSGEQVIRGANSADVDVFERGPRTGAELAAKGRFLFSGRFIWHKGLEVLAPAYQRYRELVEDPWDLTLVGEGPLASLFHGVPGVEVRSFMQPTELADLMQDCSCFILASHVDFWGVVIHEAEVAGLPIIVSDGVGAVPYLVQDGFNGWVVAAGSVDDLTSALVRMSTAGEARLQEMSDGSRALATRLTPKIWARHFHEEVARRLPAATGRSAAPAL